MTSAQAELLIANARRAAAEIVRHGWRPDASEVRRLRLSAKHAPAYRILARAWRRAGFKLAAVRKLAGRARS
jgi:hypothetical protein